MFKKFLTPELVKQMRINAGLSREEVAELIDVSPQTIANYETKGVKMDIFQLEKFIMITTTSKEDREKKQQLLQDFGNNLMSLIPKKKVN
ncbi:helix-turn-helix transcriptional regulator [Paraglaciecola sp. 20A4]|uniref:helix-turn-helix domain-containing protein n=1 Tax=Paraglaciecola sp. 20A4 TaxID=2687288 RepID=UPI001407D3C6|nr:helix-turn-helix transcriptional regulator [Paraglaciecola sp. 20A4]